MNVHKRVVLLLLVLLTSLVVMSIPASACQPDIGGCQQTESTGPVDY